MEQEEKKISINIKTAIIVIIVISIIIFTICFFIFNKNNSKKTNSTITNVTSENISTIENGTEESNSSITQTQEDITNTKEYKNVKLNDKITIDDFCEITVKSHKFANKIEPPNPTGYYSYYNASSKDYTYFDLQLNIKNLQSSQVKQNSLADVTLIYNDKYEYNCFEVTEEKNGGNFETFPNLYSIDPLKTLKYHFLVEVPKDVKNGKESLKAIIKSNGEEFSYIIR